MIIPIELRFKANKDSKSVFRTEKTIKSHDVNSVEFHITIDGLELTDNHTSKILSVFHTSKSQANVDCEIVEGKIIYKPDTNLITRHEHVTNYVYVYKDNQSLDVREFIYVVDLSKIDETSLEVKEVYDQSYADLLADFEQDLSDYKDSLPQADSVRADIDEILNQFSEDSQAMLSLVNEAESLRVEAEGNRDSAETSRVQAEAQREVKETSRVEAETQRVSAELSRVSAEAQRKIDHANRSAELDGKADKVVIKNEVPNGSFNNGLTGWVGRPASVEIIDNRLYNDGTNAAWVNVHYPRLVKPNNVYYHGVTAELISNTVYPSLSLGTVTSSALTINKKGLHTYSMVANSGVSPNGNFSLDIPSVEGYFDNFMLIDLTQTFGAGNEPTKEEMDKLIEITGYIDGEYALNNKEMLGHLMKGIREKANKKQEDWITPTLLNGWYAIRPSEPPQYMKDEFGFVHFRGAISKGESATSNVAFQLPIGYRPNVQTSFSISEVTVSPSSIALSVFANGNVDFAGGTRNSWYAISSITFKAV